MTGEKMCISQSQLAQAGCVEAQYNKARDTHATSKFAIYMGR